MPQILVRNLSERAVDSLKARAKRNGRSMEAEARAVLEDAAAPDFDFWAEADRLRNELAEKGREFSRSEDVLREIRRGE
jgi:plasmid stability protein